MQLIIVEFINTKDGKLQFKKKSDHEIEIVSSENLKLLKNIVIDTEKNTVKTSFGECEYVGEIKASPEQKDNWALAWEDNGC